MSISELDKIDERLKQIDAVLLSKTNQNDNNHSENDEISSIDARLAEIDSQLGETNNGYSDFSPFLEARGVAKTLDSAVEIGRGTFPTTDSIVNNTNKMLGIEGEPVEPRDKNNLVNHVDELSGNSGVPSGAIGKFRHKLGEFLPGPASGAKIAPAMAAVSTALRELGLDEGYSDIIAAIGVPNFQAIAKIPGKVLRKLGDTLGTIGRDTYREAGNVESAAKFLQEKVGETNIPGVVERLETYETPFKGNHAKGEAAYEPLTADIADNVGLSQYHRAKAENIPSIGKKRQTNEGVLQREIDNLASKDVSPQVSQEFAARERTAYQAGLEVENSAARQQAHEAGSQFNQTTRPENAGRQTQDYLNNRTNSLKENAQEQTRSLYEAAKNKTLDGSPSRTLSTIEHEMGESLRSSDTHRDMIKSRKAIEEAGGDVASAKAEFIENIKRNLKDDPKMMEIALREAENAPRGTFTAGNLDKARKQIKGMIEKIPTNEKERRNALRRVINSLDRDLESIPEIGAAQSLYRELMAPANYITEHPIIGGMLKRQKGYIRQFTVTPAEIPQRVISGSKSVEAAEALMTECAGLGTAEHSQAIGSLRSYINSEILGTFVENSGKVNPAKFEAWKKSNPGAFILDPQLNNKLKNLENAQLHVDRTISQNEELLSNFHKSSMEKFLGSKFEGVNSDRVAGRILDSSNSESVMEDAVNLVSKDKTGNAKEGLKRSVIDHLKAKFKSDKFTFATLNDYLNKNKKALGKLFDKDQIEVLEKSKDLLKKQAVMERLGRGDGNSNTVPKLLENIAEMTGGKASEALFGIKMPGWIGKVGDLANSITQQGKLKYLEEALLEPKMASFLLTKDVKTKKNFFDSLDNKEDFSKWLRDSESLWKTTKETIKEVGGNFSITSQALLKAKLNDE